jgi:hypothetical protein
MKLTSSQNKRVKIVQNIMSQKNIKYKSLNHRIAPLDLLCVSYLEFRHDAQSKWMHLEHM